ncbi:hypothetical protein [Streptomyces sp. NPDC047972]|uniref:hypothetical protein n=1 Tax=Streptomyces sp. NPDC047972 TaxID=3365493 RepID=UPI0037184BB1
MRKQTVGSTADKASALTHADAVTHIRRLPLGDDPNGFGPLIRKYYVETAEPFPAIPWGGE